MSPVLVFGDIPGMLVHHFHIISDSCRSVSIFVALILYWNQATIGIYPVLYEILFPKVWRYSWECCTLFWNYYKAIVSLPVLFLPYNLTKIWLMLWYLQFRINIFLIYLGETPLMFVHEFQQNLIVLTENKFLVFFYFHTECDVPC